MENFPHKPKMVFISDVATPQQIKFCNALQPYFEARFLFYESASRTRGEFWVVDSGDYSQVIDTVWFRRPGPFEYRYVAPKIGKMLGAINPDILMLGGFSRPGNYLAYRWARAHGKKTIVFTERSRNHKGVLRKMGWGWRFLRWLYRDVDMVMVSDVDIVPQFRDEFGFGARVVAGRYPSDIDAYFSHANRQSKRAYTYLLPNRMTAIYNPLLGLEIFAEIHRRYPGSLLLINAAGELGAEVKERVRSLGLTEDVEFLTNIPSWDNLHEVYERSDIMLLPASFSNGNFTIIEAMASGMGIVISEKVLGVGSMIQDGRNGFSCPPTVEEFVDRIEKYIARPSLFSAHAAINRPMVKPLSIEDTARFFSKSVIDFFQRENFGEI